MIEDSSQAFRDDLAAYALGALDAERRREVEARLESDPELQAELEDLQDAAASLALLAPSQEPPRGLKSRLLQRFEMELDARRTVGAAVPVPTQSFWARVRRRVLAPRVAYAAPAMVMVAIAASAVSIILFNGLVDQRIDDIEGQMTSGDAAREITAAKLQETEQKLERQTASKVEEAKAELNQKTESRLADALAELEALKATVKDQSTLLEFVNREGTVKTWMVGEADARDATAVLASNRPGEPAMLWVNGLAPAPEGKQYQLWLYYQGRIWSPGTFSVRPNGTALIGPLYLPLAVTTPMYTRVTIEPLGGSASPTGPDVLIPRR